MKDAYRAAIATMLKKGHSVDDIRKELPAVSAGEIAAVAEVEGLTTAHTQPKDSTPVDRDTQIDRALTALAWGENSHTPSIRKLATRTREGLADLMKLQRDAAKIEDARAQVTALEGQLGAARAALRRIQAASPAGEMDKAKRNEIRQWARSQGMQVGQAGTIPKKVMEAWERRNASAGTADSRQNA